MSSDKMQQAGGSVTPGGSSATAPDKPSVVKGGTAPAAPNGTTRAPSAAAANGGPVRPSTTGATAPAAGLKAPGEKSLPGRPAPQVPAPAVTPATNGATTNGVTAKSSGPNGSPTKAPATTSGPTTPHALPFSTSKAPAAGSVGAATAPRRPGVGEASAQQRPSVSVTSAPSKPGPSQAPRISASVGPQKQSASAGDPHEGEPGDGLRKVRLTVANVDPWSVMKLSFLLAVASGIVLVVAVVVLWMLLDRMGVFADVNGLVGDIGGKESTFDLNKYVGFGRVVSLATVVGIVNVLIITALSTIGAFLYNLGSGLVGGLQVTLTDD